MVKRVSKNHYVATNEDRLLSSVEYGNNVQTNRSYRPSQYFQGEENKEPSEHSAEYAVYNEETNEIVRPPRKHRSKSQEYSSTFQRDDSDANKNRHRDRSEDYAKSTYRPPSQMSRGSKYSRHSGAASDYSYKSGPPRGVPSEISTIKSKTTRKPGLTIETMAAPNPFCPNTKGICCLMLLLNLGLILVTLGFVIVIQFFEPLIVWVLGIIFLVFGFVTLMGSLVYCVYVCRDSKTPKQVATQQHYWTHHWQKSFGATPEKMYHPSSDQDSNYNSYNERERRRY